MNLMNTHTQPSAEKSGGRLSKKLLTGALATAMLVLAGTNAQAIEFSKDEWSGSFDTTISYGAAWRAGDLKEDYVGKAYLDPLIVFADNATKRLAPGRWSVNIDDGNRNYPEGGDLVSHTIKFTSELDISRRNYGLFTRFMGVSTILRIPTRTSCQKRPKNVLARISAYWIYMSGLSTRSVTGF
jgi:hypothetical protein